MCIISSNKTNAHTMQNIQIQKSENNTHLLTIIDDIPLKKTQNNNKQEKHTHATNTKQNGQTQMRKTKTRNKQQNSCGVLGAGIIEE